MNNSLSPKQLNALEQSRDDTRGKDVDYRSLIKRGLLIYDDGKRRYLVTNVGLAALKVARR